jgi:hypothetical protein
VSAKPRETYHLSAEAAKEENHHMAIEKELVDQLLAGRDPSDVFAKDGLRAAT